MQSLTGELKPTEQRLEQCCTFLLPGLPFPGWCGQDSALLCAFPSPASARGIYFSGVSPSGQPCWLSLLLPGWPMRPCWTDWNHPELMQLPQVNDDFHSLLTHLSNYQETVFPSVHVLKPAGVSPVFYSDPKEHSRTEKYTLKRNTRNPRPHSTQKYPERVCHVQTVNPTPNTRLQGKLSQAGQCSARSGRAAVLTAVHSLRGSRGEPPPRDGQSRAQHSLTLSSLGHCPMSAPKACMGSLSPLRPVRGGKSTT